MLPRRFPSLLVLSAVLLAACEDPPKPPPPPAPVVCQEPPSALDLPSVPPPADPPSTDPATGDHVLRRLTNAEYDNTVRDLLGDTSAPGQNFPPDDSTIGFAVATEMSGLTAEYLMTAAEHLAAAAVLHLSDLLPCDPQEVGEDLCAQAFITQFATKAYRMPVSAEEVGHLHDLYATAGNFQDGVELVISTILQSPRFLYVREQGDPTAAGPFVALQPYELASRLSYALWNTMPDEALFQAAGSGQLGTDDGLRAQVKRMLADPKAQDAVGSFFSQWLTLDQLTGTSTSLPTDPGAPLATPELAEEMRTETQLFGTRVFFDDGHLQTLLTAPYTYANIPLAQLYGITPPTSGGFFKLQLDPSIRSGLLTQASFLTLNASVGRTSPTRRGKFIRERLLCQALPPPPGGVTRNLSIPPGSTKTTRDLLKEHTTNPACSSCHNLIDPIGLGFEAFDAIGRYQQTSDSPPIDVSGELIQTDTDGPFNGPLELGKRLAQSQQVRQCMTHQWFLFLLRRKESVDDGASLGLAGEAFANSDEDMRELVNSITLSEAFRSHHRATQATP